MFGNNRNSAIKRMTFNFFTYITLLLLAFNLEMLSIGLVVKYVVLSVFAAFFLVLAHKQDSDTSYHLLANGCCIIGVLPQGEYYTNSFDTLIALLYLSILYAIIASLAFFFMSLWQLTFGVYKS